MAIYIQYEALKQAAMRGVMREALRQVAANGMVPGDHHFYVTFRTRAPGVRMAGHLVERFPDEMTIVIQHQFWDLEVHDTRFEIILKFAGVPQHLDIPYAAVSRFIDPAANFGLAFERDHADAGTLSPAPETPEPPRPQAPGTDATIVSLDAFRRK